MKVAVISLRVGDLGTIHKDLKKNTKTSNQRKNQDDPDHSIVKIS